MPEPATATSAAPQAPAQTPQPNKPAANIARNVQNRAAGTPPQPPAKPPEAGTSTPAPADPNAGKKKYVVEGKEYWLTPDQAESYVSKGIGYEPKVSEIARIRQEMIQLQNALLNNPGAVLMNLAKQRNIPIGQVVQNVLSGTASDEVKEATGRWYYENVAKRHQMDPKDLQILELEEKNQAFEQERQRGLQGQIMAENIKRVQANIATIKGQIIESLAELGIKNVETPLAARIVKDIADVMRVSYFSGQPCTAKQAVEKIRQRVYDMQSQFYDELDGAALIERLGEKNVEKIRQHLLKKVQDAESGTRQNAGERPFKPRVRNERETITPDDMHDYLDELKRTNALPTK